MTELRNIFADLPQAEPSPYLHKKIMRGVFLVRWRIPLISLLVLLMANTLALSWFVLEKMLDMETWPMLVTLFDDFQAGYATAFESLTDIVDFIPWQSLILLSVNIAILLLIIVVSKKTIVSFMMPKKSFI